ncbi:MAG: alkaline shock response membrane anchor protein AmaP [Thermoplasmata archaeon]|nr:alkaline shock response membrane anchor protein AmaP [Thermoplasmata archaeon]
MPTLEELRRRLDATAWLGVGIVGALIFVLGVYQPALYRLPYAQYLQVVVAIFGGALAVLGLSFWWDQREDERQHPRVAPLKGRAREIAIAPSFEVYKPGPINRPPRDGESPPDPEPDAD